jgi:hypothetical protein
MTETNSRPGQKAPPVKLQDSALLVGPGLISRGQKITYTCLIDDGGLGRFGEGFRPNPYTGRALQVTHSLRDVEIRARYLRASELDHLGSWIAGLSVLLALSLGMLSHQISAKAMWIWVALGTTFVALGLMRRRTFRHFHLKRIGLKDPR